MIIKLFLHLQIFFNVPDSSADAQEDHPNVQDAKSGNLINKLLYHKKRVVVQNKLNL
jgi:hypothetical protein